MIKAIVVEIMFDNVYDKYFSFSDIEKYVRENASKLGSDEFVANFIDKFQQEFIKQDIISVGPDAKDKMQQMTEKFIEILMSSIINSVPSPCFNMSL